MNATKLSILLGLAAVVLGAAVRPATAQTVDADRAARIKAGMVLNFIRYTEWPSAAFSAPDSPIVVTIVGDAPLAGHIKETVGEERAHERTVEVRRVEYPRPLEGQDEVPEERLRVFHEQLRASHAIFVCQSEDKRLESILGAMGAASVLTVSDIPGFAERGGMLGMTIRRDRVAFDANQEKINATPLKVSSHVLRLARLVKSQTPETPRP